jgi:hypothetical protein
MPSKAPSDEILPPMPSRQAPPGEAHLTLGMSALLLLGGGIGYAKVSMHACMNACIQNTAQSFGEVAYK